MIKLALCLGVLLLLFSCSSSETSPEAGATPPDASATSGADSLLTDAEAAPASTTASATPAAESTDSFLATPVDGSSGSVTAPPMDAASLAPPTPPVAAAESTPPPGAAAAENPTPTVSVGHEVPATSPMPTAKQDPTKYDTDQEYKEYAAKEETRKARQKAYDERALFPHEDGALQISLDYPRNAFPNYDFDPTIINKGYPTQGGTLSINYFPLRSLSYGRFGIGVQAGAYWTKFAITTTQNLVDSSTVHSFDAYGAKVIYEFDYFLGQILVPWAFYAMDKVKARPYSLGIANSNGSTTSFANYPGRTFERQTFGGGLNFNLNRVEPVTASRALANVGIRKTYLAYTYLAETAGSGASHFLGLRFEY